MNMNAYCIDFAEMSSRQRYDSVTIVAKDFAAALLWANKTVKKMNKDAPKDCQFDIRSIAFVHEVKVV